MTNSVSTPYKSYDPSAWSEQAKSLADKSKKTKKQLSIEGA